MGEQLHPDQIEAAAVNAEMHYNDTTGLDALREIIEAERASREADTYALRHQMQVGENIPQQDK